MQLEATAEEQQLLADTLERDKRRLERREVVAEAITATAFLAVAAVLLAIRPPHAFDPATAAVCVVVLAVSTRVRFYVPSGFTLPTQLAYVPLVLAVPIGLGPVAVLLAFLLAVAPDVLLGRARPRRFLLSIGNSWFAIGPAAVFAAFDVAPRHAGVSVLMLALAAQFAGDFSASSVRDMLASGAPVRTQLRETWVYAVDAGLSPVALAVGHQAVGHPVVAGSMLPLLGLFGVFARERRARLESLIELKDAYHGTALVLGEVIEADDGYTGEHSRGVVQLALSVGSQLGLDGDRLRNLEFGALLHDVGKVAIPKEIINKPGKLDASEWLIIKTHTVEGQRMLERVGGFMRQVGLIVRSHHERWDGEGYPDGLAGEDIPLESRIIGCCDAWNAMRTTRAYRQALSHETAVAELRAGSGRQFDPRIVDALLDIVGETEPRGAREADVLLDGGAFDQPALTPPLSGSPQERFTSR